MIGGEAQRGDVAHPGSTADKRLAWDPHAGLPDPRAHVPLFSLEWSGADHSCPPQLPDLAAPPCPTAAGPAGFLSGLWSAASGTETTAPISRALTPQQARCFPAQSRSQPGRQALAVRPFDRWDS